MHNIKPLLVFDFFGVIVGEVAHTWLKEHLGDEHANKLIKEVLVQADEGVLTEEQLFARLARESGVSPETIKDDWFKLGSLNLATVEFIKNNRHKYHIALLSNAIQSYVDQYFEMYDLHGLFDKVFISSTIKLAKPHQEVFVHVLENFPYPYSTAVMIDDSPTNVKGAINAGLKGVIFTNMGDAEQQIIKALK